LEDDEFAEDRSTLEHKLSAQEDLLTKARESYQAMRPPHIKLQQAERDRTATASKLQKTDEDILAATEAVQKAQRVLERLQQQRVHQQDKMQRLDAQISDLYETAADATAALRREVEELRQQLAAAQESLSSTARKRGADTPEEEESRERKR
jgi:predicted transcriptional regulator